MKYVELCEVYEDLEKNPSYLKKIEILSEFLKKIKKEKEKSEIYLVKGRIFPDYDDRVIGISNQLVIKALSKATGVSNSDVVKLWKKTGDLGITAGELVHKKKQSTLSKRQLTTEKVLENLRKLPDLEGKGTIGKKIGLISELLTSASPSEAKYLIRTLLGDLRVGVGEGVLRDAIVKSCLNREIKTDEREKSEEEKQKQKEMNDAVQDAYDKSTDWKNVFDKACKGKKELEKTILEPGRPVKVMLFKKETTMEKGFDRVGKPALLDYKYDGFRMMINKAKNGEIKIFTRRLDNVTTQFPDVVNCVKKNVKAKTFILDSEAVGYDSKTKEYVPFQNISQRIKRKYHIDELVKKLPIEINVFDILYYNGKPLIKEPFKKRRKIIEKIIKQEKYKIRTSKAKITGNVKEAKKFNQKALSDGQEGVMMKNLEAPYKPGSRVGYGIKIKAEPNEFDLVIIKAEYGTGKRAGWLTSYTVACRNDKKEDKKIKVKLEKQKDFLEIGKVSTGLKEKESEGLSFKELTKKIKPLIQKEKGRTVEVKPKLVVMVRYQNIQRSPKYSSGYALRFPRISRLREDKSISEIASVSEIKKEHEKQTLNIKY